VSPDQQKTGNLFFSSVDITRRMIRQQKQRKQTVDTCFGLGVFRKNCKYPCIAYLGLAFK
jgi:hypothetical protein